MRKLLFLVVSLLLLSGVAQTQELPRPHWVKNVPFAPREAGYIFASGKGADKTVPQAEKKAFADAVKTALLELGEVELSDQKLQDIEENGLEAAVKYAVNRKIRQTRVTEPILLTSGKWLVYVLIQVQEDGETPVKFNYLPENFSAEDADFSVATKAWNEKAKIEVEKNQKNKEKEIKKYARHKKVSSFFYSIGDGIEEAFGNDYPGHKYFTFDMNLPTFNDGMGFGFSGRVGGTIGIGLGLRCAYGADGVSFSYPKNVSINGSRANTYQYCISDMDTWFSLGQDDEIPGGRFLYTASIRLYAFKGLFVAVNYGTHVLRMDYADNTLQTLKPNPYYSSNYYEPNVTEMERLRNAASAPSLHWSVGYAWVDEVSLRIELGYWKNPLTNSYSPFIDFSWGIPFR